MADRYQRRHYALSTQSQEFMRAAVSWMTSSPSTDLHAWGARMLFTARDLLGLSAERRLWMQITSAFLGSALNMWVRKEQLSVDIRLQLKDQRDSLDNLWKRELQSFARREAGGMICLGKIGRAGFLWPKCLVTRVF